jgi:2'-5' RNA ligase
MEGLMGFMRGTDRLFFGAFPDPKTANDIVDVGWEFRDEYGLKGLPLLPRHIHSTLWHVGDSVLPPPQELIEELAYRGGKIRMPRFRVSFDHVESFNGGALVLRGQEGVAGLEMLHQRLGGMLDVAGRRSAAPAFTPHVTLLRDKRLLSRQPIKPIDWMVTEFVLVHSLLGKTTHRHLARFPLD